MKYSFTSYYVEVIENGIWKIVPHNKDKKHFKFIDRKKCIAFRDELILKYPDKKFRYVKERIENTHYE